MGVMTMPMGARSRLVLAKLGFDMRPAYDAVLQEPPPPKVAELIQQLPGHEDIVVEFPGEDVPAVISDDEPQS